MLPSTQSLVEYVMYVSQGEIPISGGDAAYQWSFEDSVLTSRSVQQVGVLACHQKNFSTNIINPKDGVSLILSIIINGRHQVNLRILHGTIVLVVVCKMKPGGDCQMCT